MKKLQILNKIKRALYIFFDKNVPIYKKIILIICLLYFLSPFDLIPEVIFGFGIIDDLIILIIIIYYFKDYYKNNTNLNNQKNKKDFKLYKLDDKKK